MRRETLLIEVSPTQPDLAVINRAADILRGGGLVAFPTETVYGLGADALNPDAVKKIFSAKHRPTDNPMIVHVAALEDLRVLVDDISTEAIPLMKQFWPGPLTLIFRKSRQVSDAVTGGQETVAVRMPRNIIALALIRALGHPIAAPSANLSGRPSPTTGRHVLQDLKGEIDMILDGGPVEVGVESTVLDLSHRLPAILRPGSVTWEELEPFIGKVVPAAEGNLLKRSPGTRYRHYSPQARVTLVELADQKAIDRLIAHHTKKGIKVGILSRQPQSLHSNIDVVVRSMPQDLKVYAMQMFAIMRELDELGVDEMIIEKVEEKGIGVAIMDRLRRAASR
ncbi:MAG: threonylcarbamoyl-AMP synthase [Chloroflexi bacterium RBG_13_53_26]|jgi:L-threonylcarbamoyladenylate synthase|nr:MAG: threonylcarbamoyl-AMP synthase [Chloroflexi bacterium RBG_13_53_26]